MVALEVTPRERSLMTHQTFPCDPIEHSLMTRSAACVRADCTGAVTMAEDRADRKQKLACLLKSLADDDDLIAAFEGETRKLVHLLVSTNAYQTTCNALVGCWYCYNFKNGLRLC